MWGEVCAGGLWCASDPLSGRAEGLRGGTREGPDGDVVRGARVGDPDRRPLPEHVGPVARRDGPSVRVSTHCSGHPAVHGGKTVPLPDVPCIPASVNPGHTHRAVCVAILGWSNTVHGGTAVSGPKTGVSNCRTAVHPGTFDPPVTVYILRSFPSVTGGNRVPNLRVPSRTTVLKGPLFPCSPSTTGVTRGSGPEGREVRWTSTVGPEVESTIV